MNDTNKYIHTLTRFVRREKNDTAIDHCESALPETQSYLTINNSFAGHEFVLDERLTVSVINE